MLFKTSDGKIVVKYSIPSSLEIADRILHNKFGEASPILIRHIIMPCAEECEKIINELLDSRMKVGILKMSAKTARSHGENKNHCPICQGNSLDVSHKYCHHCGSPIVWLA